MRPCFSFLFITIFALLCISQVYAATQITGTVTAKQEGLVKIEFEPHKTAGPKSGDLVDFKTMIQGMEVNAGQGQVTESETNFAWVKITKGRPNLKMTGTIMATGVPIVSSIHLCDKLAGDPWDNQRIGPSVNFSKIDTSSAISACKDAVKNYPATGRFLFQLARAFTANKQNQKAVQHYRLAIDQGYVAALYNLGVMYHVGDGGFSQNDVEAGKWWRKAAEQGHAVAMNNIGWMYETGTGFVEDNREAVKWYRKSAEQGYARGQHDLAEMYEHGKGVFKNKAEARKWYRKAAAQDYEEARKALKRLGASE